MRTELPTKCFIPLKKLRARLGPLNRFKLPRDSLLTVPMRFFCCGSLLPVFGVRGLVVSPYIYFCYVSSVWVAEWPSFGKALSTRLTICSL